MVKAILEFDLPEEECNYRTAIDGHKWKSAYNEVWNFVREKLKYHELTKGEGKAYEEIREKLIEALGDENLDLD